MPLFAATSSSQKRAIPIILIIFFVVLINLIMIYRYIPILYPDLKEPPQIDPHPPHLPDDHPPHYGLKIVRPKPSERKFKSQVLEDFMDSVEPTMKDKDLYVLLQNCLPNTLDTTVEWFTDKQQHDNDSRTFLITGDSKDTKIFCKLLCAFVKAL